MRSPLLLLYLSLPLSACSFFELPDRCLITEDSKFIELVEAESNKNGIRYKREAPNKFCYFNTDIAAVEEIKKQIDSYYRSVVTLLNDQKIEEKLLEWLKTDKLDYKIVNSGGGQRVLLVYSESKQQAENNQQKLNKIVSMKNLH